jgi:3-deoxy-manno-octulosonate cytidylyltransferase (CMP-KDO synthetase)
MLKILGLIPARYASTRFPRKLLTLVENKTIIQMVYEQAIQCNFLSEVYVATDNIEIFDHVQSFGGKVIMTDLSHTSGTERCAEAARKLGGAKAFDFVINIQGDEPIIQPEVIDNLAASLDDAVEIASMYLKINTLEDVLSPNVVKVVLNKNQNALYFSRSPIPFIRDVAVDNWLERAVFFKHIGLYAYQTEVLERIVKIPQAKLEDLEKLEQLRWVYNCFKIKMIETFTQTIGIDTPEDLDKLRQFLRDKKRI